jgi:6-pyruvoyltetrahydropterin/6-carboxytetrahydropterin synthase
VRSQLLAEFHIDAAHLIDNHPGKCKRLHGHTYKIEVLVDGEVDPKTGMVLDFGFIKEDFRTAIDLVADHQFLNEVYPDMLTTAENLAVRWLTDLRVLNQAYVGIRVWEGRGNSATATADEVGAGVPRAAAMSDLSRMDK